MNDIDINVEIEKCPKYNQMVRQLENLEELEYEDVCELERDLIDLQIEIKNKLGAVGLLLQAQPLCEDIENVSVRKRIIEIDKSEEAEHFILTPFLVTNC